MLILTPLLGATMIAATVAPSCPPECSDDKTTATIIATDLADTTTTCNLDAAQLLTATLSSVDECAQSEVIQRQIGDAIGAAAYVDLGVVNCPEDTANIATTGNIGRYLRLDDDELQRFYIDGDRVIRFTAPTAKANTNTNANTCECTCKCCNDGAKEMKVGQLLPPVVMDAPKAATGVWSVRDSDLARDTKSGDDDQVNVTVDVRALTGDKKGTKHSLPFMIQVEGDLKDVDLSKLIEKHGLTHGNVQVDFTDLSNMIDLSTLPNLNVDRDVQKMLDGTQKKIRVKKTTKAQPDGVCPHCGSNMSSSGNTKKNAEAFAFTMKPGQDGQWITTMKGDDGAKAEAHAYAFTMKPGENGQWVTAAGKDGQQWITTLKGKDGKGKAQAHAFTMKADKDGRWVTSGKDGQQWITTLKDDSDRWMTNDSKKNVNEWTSKSGDQCIIIMIDEDGNMTSMGDSLKGLGDHKFMFKSDADAWIMDGDDAVHWFTPKDGKEHGMIFVPHNDFKFDTRLNVDTKLKEKTKETKKKREVKILQAPQHNATVNADYTIASFPAAPGSNQFLSQPVAYTTTSSAGLDETARVIVQNGVVRVVSEGGTTIQECELQKCDRLQVLDDTGRKLYELNLNDGEWQTTLEKKAVIKQQPRQPSLSNLFSSAESPKVVMGVSMGLVDKSLASHLGVEPEEVILVTQVHEGLPASRCGVKQFDIITHIDGEPSLSPDRVREILTHKEPGQQIELQVLRAGQCCQTIEVELDPADQAMGAASFSFESGSGGHLTVDGDFGSLVQVLEGASQMKGIDASNAATQYWMLNSLEDLEGLEWADSAGITDENGVVQRFLIRTPAGGEWQIDADDFGMVHTEVDLSSDDFNEIIDLAMSRVADETEAASRLLEEVETTYREGSDGTISEVRRDDMKASINRIEARLERLEALLGELIQKN